MDNQVSIILPHFRTKEMVKLCLHCIRKYTNSPFELIVVDNGSGDHPSLDYLKTVKWIKLLIRQPKDIDPDPNRAHRDALQVGLDAANHPYILSMHSDAFVLQEDWLIWMLAPMLNSSRIAATGTYKLAYRPYWHQVLVDIKHAIRRTSPNNPSAPFIRSHCALYKRDILDELKLGFISDQTAGREIYFKMLEYNYYPMLLPVRKMAKYVTHINHGTMAINPELCTRMKTVTQGGRRIQKFYASKHIQEIYSNQAYSSD